MTKRMTKRMTQQSSKFRNFNEFRPGKWKLATTPCRITMNSHRNIEINEVMHDLDGSNVERDGIDDVVDVDDEDDGRR